MNERVTFKSVDVRPVLVPLKRPVVSKVGHFDRWPLILIDLHTEEGIVGKSYLEPYLADSARYIVPAVRDLANSRKGKPIRPLDDFQTARKSLNLVGYEGIAMIAIAGLDMAEWDVLAKAAGLPLAELLGGSVGEVPAYNSNGLWLTDVKTLGREAQELVAEGRFRGLKLRLGRERLSDDLHGIRVVREAVGDDVKLMVDFNQGLTLGDALHRCHALDDEGLYWFEEPTTYNNLSGYAQLARELKTPVQLGENFYGPRELQRAIQMEAGDYVMPDLMRIGGVSGWLRAVPIAAAMGIEVSTHLYPEVAAHLMRVTETAHWLEWQDWAYPILADPFAIADGRLVIPRRPGCGIDWDESAVRQFAYEV
ncbi:MAG TPA: enolase C-terminal domain-like protein [Casimicrobiaceae bacterium]|nr:enolase C-terminal domain-like protein [Casimicrobiaceae bacterium]